MPKQPKPTAEPPTAPNRLTPQGIGELRESARRMIEKMRMRSILAARKKAGGGGIGFHAGADRGGRR
jgi:hypothetical protein